LKGAVVKRYEDEVKKLREIRDKEQEVKFENMAR